MKRRNIIQCFELGFIIISLLIASSLLNPIRTKALLNTNDNSINVNSFDRFAWKWSTTEVITTETMDPYGNPSIATDYLGNVHVAWLGYSDYGGSGGDADIFYKRWDALSSSWTSAEVVSEGSTEASVFQSLTVDKNGNVHIAWRDQTSDFLGSGVDDDIFYRRYDSSTSSWSSIELISTVSSSDCRECCLVTDSSGNIHIAWRDATDYDGAGTDSDIFYRFWNADTTSWLATEVVSIESSGSCAFPSLIVDSSGFVHISWQDLSIYGTEGGDWDIVYKNRNPSTDQWSKTEVVSTGFSNESKEPSIGIDLAGNIHVAWEQWVDLGLEKEIYYKLLDKQSASWTSLKLISVTGEPNLARAPFLAVDSFGNIHIAWFDSANYSISGTDVDVLYRCWESSSKTWSTTNVVSTESTDLSEYPSLAIDIAGTIHIAWHDTTDYLSSGTNHDVFYKKLIGPPEAPVLSFIVPNPTELTSVNLEWNDVLGAEAYYIYRSDSFIYSITELEPIDSTVISSYSDVLPSEGYYYYIIVAENFVGKSAMSNCQYIEYKLPTLSEFIFFSSLISGSIIVVSVLIFLKRKNSKRK